LLVVALDAIATALSIFDFGSLFKFDVVLAALALFAFGRSQVAGLMACTPGSARADGTGEYGTCPRPKSSSGSSMVSLPSAAPRGVARLAQGVLDVIAVARRRDEAVTSAVALTARQS
jgi:hypothetical protein